MPASVERFLPSYDVRVLHSIEIAATPEVVAASVSALTIAELPLTRALFAVRGLASRFGGDYPRLDAHRPLLGVILSEGFVELAHDPDRATVVGAAGRFWTLRGAPFAEISGLEDFARFSRPGSVRAAMDFRCEPTGPARTRLTTETRVQATDADARRTFRRYWRIVYPGSALIRYEALRAIRRKAERA